MAGSARRGAVSESRLVTKCDQRQNNQERSEYSERRMFICVDPEPVVGGRHAGKGIATGRNETKLTNSSEDQETSHKPPKVHRRVARAVHEIIWVRNSSTDPIGERRNDIDGDDQERPVLVPEGGGENNEEESNREHLKNSKSMSPNPAHELDMSTYE